MRLKIELKVAKDFVYDKKYFTKARGFILNQFKGEDINDLHEKKSYKYFCFSNFFPIKINHKKKEVEPFREGEIKYWLISSPDSKFIKILKTRIEESINKNRPINIGEMQFYIQNVKLLRIILKIRTFVL